MIKQSDYDIRDPSLAPQGKLRREWADSQMGVLRAIRRLKLRSLEIEIDELTTEQRSYLESWEMGT